MAAFVSSSLTAKPAAAALAHRQRCHTPSSSLLHCPGRPAARPLRASVRDDAVAASSSGNAFLPALLAAAFVSSAALLPPTADAAESFGAKRTRDLIESSGTPGAAKPDTMKTNVPFQAPGINAPPRGPGQEQGTSAVRILKDAGEQIKQNSADPDSAPFGVSKGPLVREAKKMRQPGNPLRMNKAGAESFKKQSPEPPSVKAVKTDPAKQDKGGYFILLDKVFGKRS